MEFFVLRSSKVTAEFSSLQRLGYCARLPSPADGEKELQSDLTNYSPCPSPAGAPLPTTTTKENQNKLGLALYRQADTYPDNYEVTFFASPELVGYIYEFRHLPPKVAIRKGLEAASQA